ncbi:MAG: 23S rRNA (uridine(2552)-2'-O)-methyltransferase, partial [Candidatus Korarchaeota archaeon]|nr:23S rRNA (uridine(2552)-2'-O)-methyltransferase [Candidatus Korarchaeota archaeon]
IVGDEGFVIGVDITPIKDFSESNVQTIVGDMRSPVTLRKIMKLLPEKADVVISDAAQNVSGVWEVDHACQIELAQRALEIALQTLQPSG